MAKPCLGIWHFKGKNGCVQPSLEAALVMFVDLWKKQTGVYILSSELYPRRMWFKLYLWTY